MSDLIVNESGLSFTFDVDRLFRPEDEAFYKKLSSKVSVKICDIVFLTSQDNLLFIEVKSSSPKNNREFVKEIRQKFVDSILVYVAAWANRKNTQAHHFPPLLKTPDALQRKMRLVLIVKDHKREWLLPLKDSLRRECRPIERLFSLEDTQVYNQEFARRKLKITINKQEVDSL